MRVWIRHPGSPERCGVLLEQWMLDFTDPAVYSINAPLIFDDFIKMNAVKV